MHSRLHVEIVAHLPQRARGYGALIVKAAVYVPTPQDGVATLTLNRPETRNALTTTLFREYLWWVGAYVSSRVQSPMSAATAAGNVSLCLTESTPVPSMARSGMLVLCSLLGLAGVRRIDEEKKSSDFKGTRKRRPFDP